MGFQDRLLGSLEDVRWGRLLVETLIELDSDRSQPLCFTEEGLKLRGIQEWLTLVLAGTPILLVPL